MKKLNDFERTMLENIEKSGWYGLHVFDNKGVAPNFSYTVGLSKTLCTAELIIFGFPRELSHNVLWEMFHKLKKGEVLEDGKRWSGLLEGHDCVSKTAVHPDTHTEYVRSANWFWRHQDNDGHPEVYQIVWPGSRNGLFPWESGCHQSVIDSQPKLWA